MYGVNGHSGRNISASDYRGSSSRESGSSAGACGGGGGTETRQYSPFSNSQLADGGANSMASEITGVLHQLIEVLSKLISMLSSMFGGGHSSSKAGGGHSSSKADGGHSSSKADGGHTSSKAGGEHSSSKADGGHTSSKAGGEHSSSKADGGHRSSKAGGEHRSSKAGGEHSSSKADSGHRSSKAGGSSGSTRNNEPENTTDKGKVNVVDKPIVVDGTEFDGKGATFTASSKLGDGSQGEGQKPIFILKNGATLKNVTIGDNGADGVHVYGGATLKNVHWKDVGEDALTVKSPGDLNVIGGSAYQAADKIFQVNANSNIYIKDFKADRFLTFVRTNGGQPITSNVTIEGGQFSNGKTLFRTDSKTSEVKFVGNMDVQGVATKVRYRDEKTSF
ncbi:pectate lyase [Rhizobium lemnae]|uniref:Pectate lyase n=1 Tax=Rhizobium lemnae TaxID=1214924 RepID=A0ABV8ECY5_9HYPH|nr:pectate lyase [Rhizobium lemnae]MCJ8510553.1 pectate lyase [Rhizobium lemnae]